MNPKRAFDLVYAPQVKEHLTTIERRYYGLIRQEMEEHDFVKRKRTHLTIEK